MSFGKTYTLATGAKIPQIGLGTWLSKEKEVENAVCRAVIDIVLFGALISAYRSSTPFAMATGISIVL